MGTEQNAQTAGIADVTGVDRRRFLSLAGATAAGVSLGAAASEPAGSASAAAQAPVAAAPAAPVANGTRMADAYFMATHNSYSGNLVGQVGSIVQQLDWGSRFVELDVDNTDYVAVGDYEMGHAGAGDAVDHSGGNPASILLRDWLTVVATWSAAHPKAAPIVVMLDQKTNLGSTASYAAGNLMALNDEVTSVFGDLLFPAYEAPPNGPGQLPVASLRGRVLAQLSGAVSSRMGYFRRQAHDPAVAINSQGQVVVVYEDFVSNLFYWTGRYAPDGSVAWLRYGRYDTGLTPAVAVDDNGTVVAVHRSQNSTTLWYHVGVLDGDGEISWGPSSQFDTGILPTIAFTGTNQVREVHRSQNNDQDWDWNGTVDPVTRKITLDSATHGTTADVLQPKTVASSGSRRITVSASWDSPVDRHALTYSTPQVSDGLVRPTQVAFNEYQLNNSNVLAEHAPFWSEIATDPAFIIAARKAGKITRAWSFDDASEATTPLANYVATDFLFADWYNALMQMAGAIT